jgi:predicted outer membrane repeat protein
VTLARSSVSGNTAGNSGGGVQALKATLANSTFSGNRAGTNGGGIFSEFAATLINCTVSGNRAITDGGGIYAVNAVTLTNSTVSGNSAGDDGGGISATAATLSTSTVSGNFAGSFGGGISSLFAVLTNCTVAENIAQTGGGLFHTAGGFDFILKNTIVALNLVPPGGSGPDVAGEMFTSQGHNLIGIADIGNGFSNGDIVGTSLNPIDPLLGPLANNGGPTKTHALLPGSPAIDSGINVALNTLTAAIDANATVLEVINTSAFVPGMTLRLGGEVVVVVAVDGPFSKLTIRRGVLGTRTAHAVGTGLFLTTDQRGFARKKDGNGDGKSIVDIGAFER